MITAFGWSVCALVDLAVLSAQTYYPLEGALRYQQELGRASAGYHDQPVNEHLRRLEDEAIERDLRR